MIQFLVYGISHQQCPVEVRETLHFRKPDLPKALEWFRREWPSVETLILSTCNRVELYFASETVGAPLVGALDQGGDFQGRAQGPPLPSGDITQFLSAFHGIERSLFERFAYRLEGRSAVEHLFRVASGLDSMVVGENEILGQLREAFQASQLAGTVDSFLYRWAERALRVGKLVRTKTEINEGAVSVPSVAVELAEKIFGKLAGEKVMVLGTGEMSRLTLQHLRQAGAETLYVMSSQEERGRLLAESFGGRWVSLSEWERFLVEVDILIASTAAPHPVVKLEKVRPLMEKRRHRPLFLIDIAVPRNIEPGINSLDDVYLYNIDDLQEVAQANLKLRRREVRQAETYIQQAVEEFQAWVESLEAGPTIQLLQSYFDRLLEEEIQRFGNLPDEERERFLEFARRLRSKFLHGPLETLRESAHTGTLRRTLEAIHALFRLESHEIRISDRNTRQ